MGHPVVGDPVYAGRSCGRNLPLKLKQLLQAVDRQMLHARQLELNHPVTGEKMSFTAPTAPDMATLIDQLRSYELSRTEGAKTAK
jgi:23S rRNA pseudouridine1911/1915/1917 synthase